MSGTETTDIPSLNRSKRLATIALIVAVLVWIALIISAKLLPEYVWLIHIFMLGAEAGVVGGLVADSGQHPHQAAFDHR